jgi:hypothetical protein
MAGDAVGVSQPGNSAFKVATRLTAPNSSTHTVAVCPLFKAMHKAANGPSLRPEHETISLSHTTTF